MTSTDELGGISPGGSHAPSVSQIYDDDQERPISSNSAALTSSTNNEKPPPMVHFLKCPECSFVTTQKRRFESHFPCALHNEPIRYFIYKCELCRAICTDRGIMEEHKEQYHKGAQVNILEQQEIIRPMTSRNGASTSLSTSTSSTTSPTGVASTGVTANSSQSGQTASAKPSSPGASPVPASSGVPSGLGPAQLLFNQPVACPMCGSLCLGGAEELVNHLRVVHSHSVPLPHTSRQAALTLAAQSMASGLLPASSIPPMGSNPWQQIVSTSAPNGGSNPSNSSASHHCTLCRAAFRTVRQLEGHMTTVHPHASLTPPLVPGTNQSLPVPGLSHHMPALQHLQAALMAHMTQQSTALKMTGIGLPVPPPGSHHIKMEDSRSLSPPESKRLRIVEDSTTMRMSPQLTTKGGECLSRSNGHNNLQSDMVNNNTNHNCTSQQRDSHNNNDCSIVHNTLRKTKSDIKVIRRYLLHVKGEHRDIHLIGPEELANYLQDFVLTARKKDGHEYEPESLKAFVHSLERHLKYHNYPSSVLKDAPFATTRTILHQRLLELRAMSRCVGTGNKSATSMTPDELIHAGVLGADNPQALLNTLWLFNRTYFNIGGTQRHKNLLWGQFQIVMSGDGEEYLRYTPSVSHEETRFFRGGLRSNNPEQLPLDCVEIFRIYANMRPMESRNSQDAFYLSPDLSWEQGGSWFKPVPAGVQLIAKIPKMVGLKSRGTISSSSLNNGASGTGFQSGDNLTSTDKLDLSVRCEDEPDENVVNSDSGSGGSPGGTYRLEEEEQEEAMDMSNCRLSRQQDISVTQ